MDRAEFILVRPVDAIVASRRGRPDQAPCGGNASHGVGAAVADSRLRLPVAVSMLQNPNPRPIWMTAGAPPLVGHARQRECALLGSPYWVPTRQGIGCGSSFVTAPRVFVPTITRSSIEYPSPVPGFRPWHGPDANYGVLSWPLRRPVACVGSYPSLLSKGLGIG
jgi:hypothetical protein